MTYVCLLLSLWRAIDCAINLSINWTTEYVIEWYLDCDSLSQKYDIDYAMNKL